MVKKLQAKNWFSGRAELPAARPQGEAPAPKSAAATEASPRGVPEPVKTPQPSQAPDAGTAQKFYTVDWVKTQDTFVGRQSHIKLRNARGKTMDVFLRGADGALVQGATLTGVKIVKKRENDGELEICYLEAYQVVQRQEASSAA